jgi:branched-chain amino acid transport system permease protein
VTLTFFIEQALNGLQFGLMLFLLAAGLTVVLGLMDTINLAHGSLYMIGAYLTAALVQATGSFALAVPLALLATAAIGMALEVTIFRVLYRRDHLSQVLATFALILICNEVMRLIFGPQPLLLSLPAALSGSLELLPGLPYPTYRLLIIGVGILAAILLYLLVTKTRPGMRVRAGASNREMVLVMGVRIAPLFTAVFGLGAALCAVAGALLGPLLAVQVGMGEGILILCFVVVIIGGVGSIRGALVGAILVGMVDTFGRVTLGLLLRQLLLPALAVNVGPALASMSIYLVMAGVLSWRPQGLFPARG